MVPKVYRNLSGALRKIGSGAKNSLSDLILRTISIKVKE